MTKPSGYLPGRHSSTPPHEKALPRLIINLRRAEEDRLTPPLDAYTLSRNRSNKSEEANR